MDTLKEFFNDLKERLNNPFLSSFVISWLIFNYKIPIGLLFYKIEDLKYDNKKSYFDLIESNNNIDHLLWWPLVIALVYTFIVPFIKLGIKIFYAWILYLTDKGVFWASKSTPLSVDQFNTLRQKMQLEHKALQELVASQTGLQTENDSLTAQNEELQKTITSIQSSYADSSSAMEAGYKDRIESLNKELEKVKSDWLDQVHRLDLDIERKDLEKRGLLLKIEEITTKQTEDLNNLLEQVRVANDKNLVLKQKSEEAARNFINVEQALDANGIQINEMKAWAENILSAYDTFTHLEADSDFLSNEILFERYKEFITNYIATLNKHPFKF